MANINTYRFKLTEIDRAQFETAQVGNNIGYIVIKAKKGVNYPVLVSSPEEFIFWFGYPEKNNVEMLEAIKAVEGGSCWIVRAIGKNAVKGGVDVRLDKVVPFGYGRWGDYDVTKVIEKKEVLVTKGYGTQKDFMLDLEGSNENIKFWDQKVIITVGNKKYELPLEGSGNIKNFQNDVLSGTMDLEHGDIIISFNGTPGEPAELISEKDLSVAIDVGGDPNKNVAVDIIIDNDRYSNVVLGQGALNVYQIVSAINTFIGKIVAEVYTDSNNDILRYVKIKGEIAHPQFGRVSVLPPTDTINYKNGITLFSNTGNPVTHQKPATLPTGNVPRYGEEVNLIFYYIQNLADQISHSFLTKSPYDPKYGLLGVKIKWLSGYKYNLTLYEWMEVQNKWSIREEYTYSLIEEKDEFGRSLYIYDVFKNNKYLDIYVNKDFPTIAQPLNTDEIVPLLGGQSGDDPEYQDYLKCLEYAKDRNKYRVKLFVDVNSKLLKDYLNLINNYQYFAEVISCVPIGSSVQQAIQYRNSLGIDNDHAFLTYKWYLAYDPFNDTYTWLNGLGSLAKMLLSMENYYNALPVAGYNENGFGGEIDTYRVIDYEGILNDDNLRELDQNQVNPYIYENGKIILWGQRTLTTQNTDTSFFPTRRVYNVILEYVYKTMKKPLFKFNDDFHRNLVKMMLKDFIDPILMAGYINDYIIKFPQGEELQRYLQQRKFVITMLIKATPTSEFIEFNFVRVGQDVQIK